MTRNIESGLSTEELPLKRLGSEDRGGLLLCSLPLPRGADTTDLSLGDRPTYRHNLGQWCDEESTSPRRLLLAADDEAELAGVLAHEIGHVVARHSANQLATQYGMEILAGLALGENPNEIAQIASQFGHAGVMARFSRDDEREADEYGVKYLVATGYDPAGLLSFFQKLQKLEGRKQGEVEKLLATHPATQERIRRIEKLIAKSGAQGGDRKREQFVRETALLRR